MARSTCEPETEKGEYGALSKMHARDEGVDEEKKKRGKEERERGGSD